MEEYYVVKIENGLPTPGVIHYENFRALHPSTSFPDRPVIEMLEQYGYAPWLFTPKPFAQEKRVVIEGTPVLTGGIWQQVWTDRPMDEAELAVANEQKLIEVRAIRTNKLYDCDWTQLADAPITEAKKAEWVSYRQALRNLPASITDPFDVTWPTKPE